MADEKQGQQAKPAPHRPATEEEGRQWGGGRGESDAVGRESEDQSRQSGPRGRPGVDFSPGEDINTGIDQDPSAAQTSGRRNTAASHYEVGAGQEQRDAPASVGVQTGVEAQQGHQSGLQSTLQSHLAGIEFPARKQDLIQHIRRRNGPQALIAALDRLPDQEFRSPGDLYQAMGMGR
ncbi:MAG TPA: DUF2795 domain-containing protein [Caldilineaceae bacterium]|nr:DUF2795 domain-containing protein [Caldilineaceae bacterium]